MLSVSADSKWASGKHFTGIGNAVSFSQNILLKYEEHFYTWLNVYFPVIIHHRPILYEYILDITTIDKRGFFVISIPSTYMFLLSIFCVLFNVYLK
jgi:hypothetical protein